MYYNLSQTLDWVYHNTGLELWYLPDDIVESMDGTEWIHEDAIHEQIATPYMLMLKAEGTVEWMDFGFDPYYEEDDYGDYYC